MSGGFTSGNDVESLAFLERQLQRQLPGPLTRQMNGFSDDDIYLARSWLSAMHRVVVREQETNPRDHRLSTAPKRQVLVAVCNRLDVDVEAVLVADPEEELRLLTEGLAAIGAGVSLGSV